MPLAWVPDRVLAVWLPIHLPANSLKEAAEAGPSAWAPVIHVGDPGEAPGVWLFACSRPGCCGHLGGEPID